MDIKLQIISTSIDGKKVTQIDEPVSVEIREQLKQSTSFTITYSEDICDGDFRFIQQNVFSPLSGVEIWVHLDDAKFCLVKGLVQSQQIKFVHGGLGSQLTVSGIDNTVRMSWATETKKWEKKIDAEDIILMLTTVQKSKKAKSVLRNFSYKKYVILGVPYNASVKSTADDDVQESDLDIQNETRNPSTPGSSSPDTDQQSLSFPEEQMQKADDLAFIRQLAEQKGKYFWVSYDDADGEEIAHFDDLPLQEYDKIDKSKIITLRLNHENNDIDEISVSWDADRPTSVKSEHTDRRTKVVTEVEVPIATQPKLGNVNLSTMTHDMISAFQWATVSDVVDQDDRAKAALNEAEWFIKANCATSYDRLCKNFDDHHPVKVFHAQELIWIEGAGSRHSGPYLVSGVSHSISAGSYEVKLELMRNAWTDPGHTGLDLTPEPEEELTQTA